MSDEQGRIKDLESALTSLVHFIDDIRETNDCGYFNLDKSEPGETIYQNALAVLSNISHPAIRDHFKLKYTENVKLGPASQSTSERKSREREVCTRVSMFRSQTIKHINRITMPQELCVRGKVLYRYAVRIAEVAARLYAHRKARNQSGTYTKLLYTNQTLNGGCRSVVYGG